MAFMTILGRHHRYFSLGNKKYAFSSHCNKLGSPIPSHCYNCHSYSTLQQEDMIQMYHETISNRNTIKGLVFNCPSTQMEIQIIPGWTEHCTLQYLVHKDNVRNSSTPFTVHHCESSCKIYLSQQSDMPKPQKRTVLRATLPHNYDLDIALGEGSVNIEGKMEANVQVSLGSGDISVDKIRGMELKLKTHNGNIDVRTLLEGNVILAAKNIKVKRIMGETIQIKSNDQGNIQIGALYSPNSFMETSGKGDIQIQSMHGTVTATTQDGDNNVKGITGKMNCLSDKGTISVQIDALEKGAINHLTTRIGNVNIAINPQVQSLLSLQGKEIDLVGKKINENMDQNDSLKQGQKTYNGVLEALVKNKVTISMTSGKIHPVSAQESISTSFYNSNEKKDGIPQLKATTTEGRISISQMNWMDLLKRQYGIPQKN